MINWHQYKEKLVRRGEILISDGVDEDTLEIAKSYLKVLEKKVKDRKVVELETTSSTQETPTS
jgi:hypothetical protein